MLDNGLSGPGGSPAPEGYESQGGASQSSNGELAALLEAELATDGSDEERSADAQAAHSSAAFRSSPAEFSQAQELPASKRQRTGQDGNGSGGNICPPHPGSMRGMCIRCGAKVGDAESDHVALRYIHQGLQLSQAEAERTRQRSLQRTLAERKLLLVLDLDHTLLNSTRFNEIDAGDEARLQQILEREKALSRKSLFRLPNMNMWTKLRPQVQQFLEAAREITEMHIYTHGDRDYAAAMANLLDPERRYFVGRIISQSDSTQRRVKNLDVVLGADTAVIIVDDTEGVWPHHRDNLIQVERYIFFPADAQRFGVNRECLLRLGHDENPQLGQLSTTLRILQAIHACTFASGTVGSAGSQDVRLHLRRMRAEILDGVSLCFSRVIPLAADPTSHPLWLLATQLGARCSTTAGEGTTHVVAGGTSTEKVLWALKQGIPVVSPDWLYASAFLWKRMEEAAFPVLQDGQAPAVRSEAEDLSAALAAAGGGRGEWALPLDS